jgi:hypothetical protein
MRVGEAFEGNAKGLLGQGRQLCEQEKRREAGSA